MFDVISSDPVVLDALSSKEWEHRRNNHSSVELDSLNYQPDEVNPKAVVPTAWLIKLNILLDSNSSKYLYYFTLNEIITDH